MKKIIAAVAVCAFAGSAFAAGGAVALTKGGPSSVSATSCLDGVLQSSASFTISLSANVFGAYDCDTVVVGVATANKTGKGTIFGANTGGGGVTTYKKDGTVGVGTSSADRWQSEADATIQTAISTAATTNASAARSGSGGGGASQ